MKSSRRIMFLRDSKGMAIGCLVYSLSPKRTKIRYQLSVLNPVDKFERSLARQIALGRLIEDRFVIPGMTGTEPQNVLVANIMKNILVNDEVPTRAKKAAKLWLSQSQRNSVQA